MLSIHVCLTTACLIVLHTFRYAIGVTLFKILTSATAHPYMSAEELSELYGMSDPNKVMNVKAAAIIVDAPCVQWPEGTRDVYSPVLISLVENLLIRHRNRAGLTEVRMMLAS